MDRQSDILEEKVLVATEIDDREVKITFEERGSTTSISNVVFTAASSNNETSSYRNPDTCCTCTSH